MYIDKRIIISLSWKYTEFTMSYREMAIILETNNIIFTLVLIRFWINWIYFIHKSILY